MKTLIYIIVIAALAACGDQDRLNRRSQTIPCPNLTGTSYQILVTDQTKVYDLQTGSQLAQGTYLSNDGRGCTFTINSNGSVSW